MLSSANIHTLLKKLFFTKYLTYCLFSALFCCFSAALFAEDETNHLIDYLSAEKTNLTLASSAIDAYKKPLNKEDYQRRKEKNQVELSLIATKITNLNHFFNEQQKQQQQLNQRLQRIQQLPFNATKSLQLEKINTLSELNSTILMLIRDNLTIAKHYQAQLLEERRELGLWQAHQNERLAQQRIKKELLILYEQRDQLFQENIRLQQQESDGRMNETNRIHQLFNNQIIHLVQLRIDGLLLQKKQLHADYELLVHPDIKTYQEVITLYGNYIEQIKQLIQQFTEINDLLAYEKTYDDYASWVAQKKVLQQNVVGYIRQYQQLSIETQQQLAFYEKKLKQQMASRQQFTGYRLASWQLLVTQFLTIPTGLMAYGANLVTAIKDSYVWEDTSLKLLFWMVHVLIFSLSLTLYLQLKNSNKKPPRVRLSAQLLDGMLILVQQNMLLLIVMAGVFATFLIQPLPYGSYRLFINLLWIGLLFRTLILTARLLLMDRISDVSGHDVILYHRIKWLLLAGGWSSALMIIGYQLPLSLLLQDLFNRLFMAFLLALSVMLWKSRETINYLLRSVLKYKKRYIRRAMMLLLFLLPITLFITAVMGLVGYINLAWAMGRYQLYVVVIIIGYVLIRGLLLDGLELASEKMIHALPNGWLWTEVFLKPLDKIGRLLLLLVSIWTLCQLFGWYTDEKIRANLYAISHYPFINFSGVHITLVSTIEFVFLLFLFVWAAKWTREFCYRWLYRNTRDAGIRNSLSAFSQYAVILLGTFITLRVLGLDFSGMSMVLGGLAVGMGFGLRDFASNIIGGIMLLIERPVREGDLITLGEYEGRVAHIGIRSMRVSSWDNMEVLIPNAETFNKPFTNWTHQDNIIRTVLPIKVSRSDNPITVQQLILDVLDIIPEILSDPPPQVFLKQIADALVEFEVRYYINVVEHTRFEVRSKVLFAITAQFQAAGVKPPIPPLSVELKKTKNDEMATT